ncbi:hypothetical protein AV926_17835 [Myroides marinus]|uniref:DUF3829 domain-containing protein n=1 Tax=Myroides marinus TaxID=703342 RepID=A0A163UZD2_9FLAO|nr:hypothetical protein [Myroides marinus]KZE74097.1 hypothetical protein AV926_17835 [Myroides marinus]
MKNVIIILGGCLLLLVGCKKQSEIDEAAENKRYQEKVEASQAIRYLNLINEYMFDTEGFIAERREDIEQLRLITFREHIDSLKGVPAKESFILKENEDYYKGALIHTDDLDALTEEEKDFFSYNMGKYYDEFNQFTEISLKYVNYLESKEYEHDNWVKAREYNRTITDSKTEFFILRNMISKEIRRIDVRLDTIALQGSPLKDVFITAKSDYRILQDITERIQELNKKTFDVNGLNNLNKLCVVLQNNIYEHKHKYDSELRQKQMLEDYTKYYELLHEWINETKKMLTKTKIGGRISNSELNRLLELQVRVSNQYNGMIK